MTTKQTKTKFEPSSTPMRIGAGWVVDELRRIYQGSDFRFKAETPEAMREAMRVGRVCFPEPSPLTDEHLEKIITEKATLRGYSPEPGVSYHEENCHACKGTGKRGSYKGDGFPCETCEGDGFHPPMAEMAHRKDGDK